MPESEDTETTEDETTENETPEVETRDFEAMLADSQDNLARARAVIAHYGGADLDVDTELRFVVSGADGELMYRPVVVAPDAPTPQPTPTVRPRRATPTRQAPPTKTAAEVLAGLSDEDFKAFLKKPENQFVKPDYGDNPMAITTAELQIIYGREWQTEFDRAIVYPGLCNRDHQAEIDAAYTVQIPKDDTTLTLGDHVDAADWRTAERADISYLAFTPGSGEGKLGRVRPSVNPSRCR